ncbi:MAG TPA: hypothetical protein VEM59_00110 [Acidimicrobiia bacterium]|nr:hypothetical protein [Acidimicrobiia bacterium]
MATAPGLAAALSSVVVPTADDGHRPLGVVEVENDLEVARRRRIGRLVHDRDLFLLRASFERVTKAEHPGRDDGAGRRTSKAIDWSLDRAGFFFSLVFGLVPMVVFHTFQRTPGLGIESRGEEVTIP